MGEMPALPPELAKLREQVRTDETTEDQVDRLRPRSLRMQVRYLRTLLFSVWLFGRMVFWQVYVAKVLPRRVSKGNTARWRKYAREFRTFAAEMGGVMIKVGQFASTRADILPEEVIAELSGLQDRVPTLPYPQIEAVLKQELGDLSLRYAWIDPKPIAAASLGQVHRAQLHNGDRVVVKVLRPNVRSIVYTDMGALFIVARIAMWFSFINRRADAVGLMEEFGRVLLEEVSYHKERDNAQRFAKMFESNDGVYIPHIYSAHTTDCVLTIEDVTSIKLDDFDALARAGVDRCEVAKRLMDTYMYQIFDERFFHADPHPGNLFVYPLPVEDEARAIRELNRPFYLIFIDFGMTGSLTPQIRQGLSNTLAAVITRDAKRLVSSYQELGFLLPNADVRRIEEATQTVFNQVWGMSMNEIKSTDFEVVANIGKEFNDLLFELPFRLPQDFIYLGRTVGILSGMATALDPQFNPWEAIQQRVQMFIASDATDTFFDEVVKVFLEPLNQLMTGGVLPFINSLRETVMRLAPSNPTAQLLRQLIEGEVQIETKLSQQHRRQLERIEQQGRRTTRAFLFGCFLITSTLLYTSGDTQLASWGYGATGVLGLWMMLGK